MGQRQDRAEPIESFLVVQNFFPKLLAHVHAAKKSHCPVIPRSSAFVIFQQQWIEKIARRKASPTAFQCFRMSVQTSWAASGPGKISSFSSESPEPSISSKNSRGGTRSGQQWSAAKKPSSSSRSIEPSSWSWSSISPSASKSSSPKRSRLSGFSSCSSMDNEFTPLYGNQRQEFPVGNLRNAWRFCPLDASRRRQRRKS